MHQELRLHPRMPTNLPAEMIFSDQLSLDVTMRNLSLGGMLVEGDSQLQHAVDDHRPGFPVEVELHFGLNGLPVSCRCRLIHTRRCSQTLFQMGFKLLSLDELSQTLIREYLENYELTRAG